METIIFGGGCFWCMEAVFAMLKGVMSVEPGYAGGIIANPTHEQVSKGDTGHAEVVKVEYDPDRIAFEELLQVFFDSHDSTQVGGQGSDIGPQYRSAIFYTTPRQKEKAEHYIMVVNKGLEVKKIVTEVKPLQKFYPAEEYHREYFKKNPHAGYCQLVIVPKVERVSGKFKNLLQ